MRPDHKMLAQIWNKMKWKADFEPGKGEDRAELYKDYVKPEKNRMC